MLNKKIISEQASPPGPDWERIAKNQEQAKKDLGCVLGRDSNNKLYVKKGSCSLSTTPPRPNPIDDTWETITDSKLIQKLSSGIGDFINKIKTEVPSIVQDGTKWVYKKSDDLKGFWKKYQKEHGHSSSSNENSVSNGIYTTKGDPYQYKVIDCVWYTKSLENRGKIIKDWTPLDGNQNATNILDGRFPKARKGCEKTDGNQIDGGQTITTPPAPTPVVLPTWAECIGRSLKEAVVTKDDTNVEIVMVPFGKDMGYFWNDNEKTFIFVYESGDKVGGTWSCEGDNLLIKTNDGEQWSSSTEWIIQPSKSINPNVNYRTTTMRATDVKGDGSLPSTDTTKSDKSSSTEPAKINIPTEPVSKDDVSGEKSDMIDKYGPQNESYNGLEDVLNNINSLINEIEMKEIIKEQKQSIVAAPAEELDILYKNAVLLTLGPVETLCEQKNGVSIPVNVEGRKYFAGRRTNLNQALGGGEGYFVYDGKILRRTQGCNFVYVKKGNDTVRIDGIDPIELELPSKELLSRFGIDNMDYNSNPYYFIDTITKKFQNLIAKGARSDVFRRWQELLTNYYKYDNTQRLNLTTENENNPPRDEVDNYVVFSANDLGIKYMDKQILIYVPRGASLTNQFKAAEYNSGDCRNDLVSYVNGAFDFQQTNKNDPNINNSAVRKNIRACFRAGQYKDVKLTQNDITVQFNDKDNPFKGLRGFGSELDINEIQKLLMGETFKLPNVGPNGKNEYLPFRIDARQGMTESKSKLDNLIKENLTKIKREKDSSLLIETKIIKSRTQILSENRILKFKQPREKFFNEIISEALYLNKQGFDKQIIKEEFWDSLKGLFGEHGSNAIFTTFKEYMGKYLVGKLTSINPNGWMGENIKNAINKIHIEDLDKITDCDFISRKISTSITDSIINKVSKGQDIEGGNISSIVKGGLDKSIDRTELTKNIHEGITKLICPVLGDVSKKLKEKGEEMKLKAVRP